jgi:hypothetical protein
MLTKSKNLLSVEADAKTVKGNKVNVLTGIMYLAPHTVSGFQVCPKASEGCMLACLYTAGRGIYTKVQNARINKTKWFFLERATFMEQLVKDIVKLERDAIKRGMVPAVRLNGTSDIAWEKFACKRDGVAYKNVMEAFPNINFYDYSKVLGRKTAIATPNYHLTFSLAENNDRDARLALGQGYNLAVVFDIKKKDVKPDKWSGYPVIDGDDSDVRFYDPKGGHVVALTAKGKARKDTIGFVRKLDSTLKC